MYIINTLYSSFIIWRLTFLETVNQSDEHTMQYI